MKICLVGCSKTKLDHPAPAQDLYTSPLFRLSRQWAERNAERWYILSAKYGVLPPNQVIAPYDCRLSGENADLLLTVIHDQILRQFDISSVSFTILAGSAYAGVIPSAQKVEPLKGMGIGQRIAWLKRDLDLRQSASSPDKRLSPFVNL